MSIITFWNNEKIQTGKTLSMVAIATQMAIQHNYKILIISTAYNDNVIDNCFFKTTQEKKKTNLGLFGPNTNNAVGEGIEGLSRALKMKKVSPNSITDYTKVILTENRLEILTSIKGSIENYNYVKESFVELINIANKYYDMVFVDLDKQVGEQIEKQILDISNLVLLSSSQRLSSINKIKEEKEKNEFMKTNKVMLLIGKYDNNSKYNIKNITRYIKNKNKVLTIPYNTLYFEATEEANVLDLFLKLKKIKNENENTFFISEVIRACENIIYRLELNMKMS